MSIQFDYIEEEFSRLGTQFLKRKKKKRVKQVLRHVHSINNERTKIKVKRVNLYGQGSPWNREKHRRMLSLRRRLDHRI